MTSPAGGPTDASARRLAQATFDRPVAVEAGAGTGKTTVLVARVLGWTLGPGWTEARWHLIEQGSTDPPDADIAARVLDGVVAITFTEAAAAEMASRVAKALTCLATDPGSGVRGFDPELLPDADQPALGARAKALIGALDHLAIRTIHSHCWHLLTTYPMAAGLSLDLQVDADGRSLDETVREVVEREVKAAYAGPADHPLQRLAPRMIGPRQLAEATFTLVSEGFAAEALERDPFSSPRRGEILRRLGAAVNAVAALTGPLAEQNRAKLDLQVTEALAQTRLLVDQGNETPDLANLAHMLDRLREVWSDDLIKRLGLWAKGSFTKTVSDLLGSQCLQLSRTAGELFGLLKLYCRLDVEALDDARRALQPLVAAVEDGLRARGVLTYASMMTEAWRLLENHPQVRRRERRKLRQLMVDEFQDTDRLQCELVRFLALGGEKADRPGLFVVGDPKQSIYGWRNADLEAYENFLEDLRGAGGLTVELRQNFRSVPAVLEEVDRAIAPVMEPRAGLQPAFSSLQPSDDLKDDPGFWRAARSPIEYWVSWTPDKADTRGDDAATLEARAIAADIRQLNELEGVPWSEFGLLLRSTSRLETYLEAFRNAGVPFVVTSDKHYYRRREIIEAAALIRTIIVPVDHLALVTFLRSATVGVPDAALLPLWRRNFPDLVTDLRSPNDDTLDTLRRIVDDTAASLPTDIPGLDRIAGWPVSLLAALENLAWLREAFQRESADRFLELVRERFLLDVTESARHLGVYRLANLDRFFRDLEIALEEGGGDIQGVLRTLRRSVAEAADAEQALPEGATENAVQVMTIHGAKGLEFGHVYLPQLHAKGRRKDWPAVQVDRRWLPGQEAEYVLFGYPTPGFDRVERRVEQIERTEQVRTLYVAMTRAKRRLVLLGNWPEIPNPVPTDKRATYLDLLRSRERLPDSLGTLFEACAGSPTPWTDMGSIRWRFPFLEGLATQAPPKRARPASFPPRTALKKEAQRLEKLQAAAAQYMDRRYAGAASDEAAERFERLLRDEAPPLELSAESGIARPVGDAFHRMLESWDLQAKPDRELQRQRQKQIRWLQAEIPTESLSAARARFDALLDRFRTGQFWDRFLSLRELPLAREVPVLLPAQNSGTGPVGYISGFIDLLYRDPQTSRWVVVDYKTDRLETESEIDERGQIYASQEAVYAHALREALSLDADPATQLWFIWPDHLMEVNTDS
jgi:ATP-dependent helicase/nuclease subunit A